MKILLGRSPYDKVSGIPCTTIEHAILDVLDGDVFIEKLTEIEVYRSGKPSEWASVGTNHRVDENKQDVRDISENWLCCDVDSLVDFLTDVDAILPRHQYVIVTHLILANSDYLRLAYLDSKQPYTPYYFWGDSKIGS